ncbi:MAG: protein kinase [Fuerstiella sp.]
MNISTCNPEIIEQFLAEQLDEQQRATFERHLDECDDCCRLLHERTAEATLWNDARSFLSSAELTADALPKPSPRETSPTSLDFLAPTDDPRMLGRFAGYEICGVIGSGGMGIVLKGFDLALNRYAAIKVLAPHYASSGAARQRFAREAQAAAAVVHDNVIAIHGVSECNGLPYLVMPYVKGVSLQKRIDRNGPLTTSEMLRIAMQTARGLAAAHDQGLVHRDIKPANILLPENVERVMITDFGLARAADDASLTRSGVIAGTPQYMSPEQARGEGIDHRSDLFSLGSVMYAMATGHPPFRAETPYGVLRRITDSDHRPVQEIRSDTPTWMCEIIDRLLNKNAAERFSSAKEVATLLEDCLAHVQQPATVPLPFVLNRNGRRNGGRRAVAGIIIGVAGVFLAWAALFQESPPADMSGPAASQKKIGSLSNETATPAELVTPTDLEWSASDELNTIESTLRELKQELGPVP